jgi:uncharacterized protein (TIGR03086 family)
VAEHDLVGIFLTMQDEFGARVGAVRPEQWSGDTPDTEWDVAALVAHLVTEHRWIDPLMRGLDLDAAALEIDSARSFAGDDGLGATYVQAWGEAASRAAAAFSAPGALDRSVSLARGETTATSYLRELIFDLTVHSWDLGTAIGYPGELPADVVQVVWEETRDVGDLSASGMYDRPVAVPVDAPVLDRLIAMTGRDPR